MATLCKSCNLHASEPRNRKIRGRRGGGDERFLSKRNARRVGIERATEYVGWTIVRNRTKHRPPTKRFQLERSNANLPLLLLPLLPLLPLLLLLLLLLTIARIPKVDRSLNFTFFFLFSRVLAWLLVSLLRYRVCLLTHER